MPAPRRRGRPRPRPRPRPRSRARVLGLAWGEEHLDRHVRAVLARHDQDECKIIVRLRALACSKPYKYLGHHVSGCIRPYYGERTVSRPICEVKLHQASLVLRWGTTWESEVPNALLHFFF